MEYPYLEEADVGDFVTPHTKKTTDGFETVRNPVVVNGETAKDIVEGMHRTAVNEYGLSHEDAAKIYNRAQQQGGFMGHYPNIRQDALEDTIDQALEAYSDGATADEVVDQYQLAVDTSVGRIPDDWKDVLSSQNT
jgi:hypothetical protein